MSIVPLPQFEADLEQAEREAYERLKPPSTIVVRFGVMGLVGEFPYDGKAKPGNGQQRHRTVDDNKLGNPPGSGQDEAGDECPHCARDRRRGGADGARPARPEAPRPHRVR